MTGLGGVRCIPTASLVAFREDGGTVTIETTGGRLAAGDWIIEGTASDFTLCRAEVFAVNQSRRECCRARAALGSDVPASINRLGAAAHTPADPIRTKSVGGWGINRPVMIRWHRGVTRAGPASVFG
jgi:hypothetical protein